MHKKMNAKFRQLLEEIQKNKLDEQKNKLEEIQKSQKHSITVVDSNNMFQKWGTYNCFEFALGLTVFPDYVVVKKQNVFSNSEFINYLLGNKYLEENKKGRLIIYFTEGKPKHAGKIRNNRVTSKWGTGLVFDHKILDVPYSYGNDFKTYNVVDNDTMLEYFYDFAETNGIKFNHTN